jgi:putative colanic acid biosynthesis acetyltransferase WcaF
MTERVSSTKAAPSKWVSLGAFRIADYTPGRSAFICALWYVVSLVFFQSGWCPFYGPKRWLLRIFGAKVGRAVIIKPHVRIKFPWRCRIGDHCWIGEDVWIDNLAPVHLSNDVCLSQGAFLCTGSHDHLSPTFDLIVKPIVIEEEAWIAAKSIILQGVTVGRGAVVAAGSVVPRDVPSGVIVAGSPCRPVGDRALARKP